MPNRFEIEKEIRSAKDTAQDRVRMRYLKKLAAYTGNDTILYAANYGTGRNLGSLTSIDISDLPGFMSTINGMKGSSLDLIIHSYGGTLEGAEQIINYLRAKYSKVRAIVPQNAMSAATMIACACNEIVMGKQSAIGPIDPQVFFRTSIGMAGAPAQAILDDFKQAKADVGANPNIASLWISKIQDYPPGIFTICSNLLKCAEDRVADWLNAYMFHGQAGAAKKSKDIARWLNSHSTHKTHGHPISFSEAQKRGLKVSRLEDDNTFQDLVLSVFHAVSVSFNVTNTIKIIEGHNGKRTFTCLPN